MICIVKPLTRILAYTKETQEGTQAHPGLKKSSQLLHARFAKTMGPPETKHQAALIH